MILEKIKTHKLIALVTVLYAGLLIFLPEKAMSAFANTGYYLKEMIQIMPVIFVLTVTIETWVPKETITKKLGDQSGIIGNLLSFILGSISAGPIYAAFPICKMLLKKGASITNIVIILSSWAVIKVPMLANEAKFLGPDFMATRWILTLISILAMAYVTTFIVKKKDLSTNETSSDPSVLFEIKSAYCIGCGVCTKLAPTYFEMKNSKGQLKTVPTKKEASEEIFIAIENCPTKAIQYYG